QPVVIARSRFCASRSGRLFYHQCDNPFFAAMPFERPDLFLDPCRTRGSGRTDHHEAAGSDQDFIVAIVVQRIPEIGKNVEFFGKRNAVTNALTDEGGRNGITFELTKEPFEPALIVGSKSDDSPSG